MSLELAHLRTCGERPPRSISDLVDGRQASLSRPSEASRVQEPTSEQQERRRGDRRAGDERRRRDRRRRSARWVPWIGFTLLYFLVFGAIYVWFYQFSTASAV